MFKQFRRKLVTAQLNRIERQIADNAVDLELARMLHKDVATSLDRTPQEYVESLRSYSGIVVREESLKSQRKSLQKVLERLGS